jgi:hypothetical protein
MTTTRSGLGHENTYDLLRLWVAVGFRNSAPFHTVMDGNDDGQGVAGGLSSTHTSACGQHGTGPAGGRTPGRRPSAPTRLGGQVAMRGADPSAPRDPTLQHRKVSLYSVRVHWSVSGDKPAWCHSPC